MERMPAPSRRCCIHSGDGPIFTFLSIRVEKREHKSGSAISTEKISFNLVLSSSLTLISGKCGLLPVIAAISRTRPKTLKQSARLAVSSTSNTAAFKPNTSLAGIPTGVSLGKMKIPVFCSSGNFSRSSFNS